MALPTFDIDTPIAYRVAQHNILQRLDAGDDAGTVREEWRQTIERIIDNHLAGHDALTFVTAPALAPVDWIQRTSRTRWRRRRVRRPVRPLRSPSRRDPAR
ncbi:hypothetical protein ACLBYD_09920, partial [Rhodococcus sp. C26F]